jgi:hypothetical protein
MPEWSPPHSGLTPHPAGSASTRSSMLTVVAFTAHYTAISLATY